MREIHFYPDRNHPDYHEAQMIHTFQETEQAISDRSRKIIHTTQMYGLSFAWRFHALRDQDPSEEEVVIYVHEDNEVYTIATEKQGGCCRTNKELRAAHNIVKMWVAGTFMKR